MKNEKFERFNFSLLFFREKQEQETYEQQLKEKQIKQQQLIDRFEQNDENLTELIEGFLSINNFEYLEKIWRLPNVDRVQLADRFLVEIFNYCRNLFDGFLQRICLNEEWIIELFVCVIEQKQKSKFHQLLEFIRKLNKKGKCFSQPSYFPFFARIGQRLLIDNRNQIEGLVDFIAGDNLYEIVLGLILSNNFNADESNLNLLISLDQSFDLKWNCQQISSLIHGLLMTKNSETCSKYLDFLQSKSMVDDEESMSCSLNKYRQEFLSVLIKATVYEMDEIDRRIRTRRETLVQRGETLFDLRASLLKRKSSEDEKSTVNLIETKRFSSVEF